MLQFFYAKLRPSNGKYKMAYRMFVEAKTLYGCFLNSVNKKSCIKIY